MHPALGLSIGFEYGPMTATRLGMKGDLIRCSVSRGVLAAESEQGRCTGSETAIGELAYEDASAAVRALFGSTRKRVGLSYDTAVEEMSGNGDKAAKASRAAAAGTLLKSATAPAATSFTFPDRRTGPAKPAGFA